MDEDYLKEGDLGVVALSSRASQKTLSFAAKPKPLTAAYVLEQFRTITRTKGDKAQVWLPYTYSQAYLRTYLQSGTKSGYYQVDDDKMSRSGS